MSASKTRRDGQCSAVLPFTRGPGGPYMPGAPQGWSYNAYFYDDPAHTHAVTGHFPPKRTAAVNVLQ